MGWIFCIVVMIGYFFNGDSLWLLTAGLFAISGGLSEVGGAVRSLFCHMEVDEVGESDE